MTVDPDFEVLVDRVMRDQADRASTVSACTFDRALWARLSELGLARLTGSPEAGGSGASWFEAAALLRAGAFHGVAGPLAENDLLAGWVLEQAGAASSDEAVRTLALADPTGRATGVAWADDVDSVVVLVPGDSGWAVHDLAPSALTVSRESRPLPLAPTSSIAVDLDTCTPLASIDDSTVDALRLRGALARAVQTAGALDRVLELSIDHVSTRTQFGRTLSKFQMIQSAIADIALEVALARTAVETAVRLAAGGGESGLAIAIARSVANQAASTVVRLAHQVHGAIGATDEHVLPRLTGPMLAWRADFGGPEHWDLRVVQDVVASDVPLWNQLTDLVSVEGMVSSS